MSDHPSRRMADDTFLIDRRAITQHPHQCTAKNILLIASSVECRAFALLVERCNNVNTVIKLLQAVILSYRVHNSRMSTSIQSACMAPCITCCPNLVMVDVFAEPVQACITAIGAHQNICRRPEQQCRHGLTLSGMALQVSRAQAGPTDEAVIAAICIDVGDVPVCRHAQG